MAQQSSSAMVSTVVPRASVWGVQSAFAAYSGVHSMSVSDRIEFLRLPRNAIVDQIIFGGILPGVTGAGYGIGDDLSNYRYGTVSLSATSLNLRAPTGLNVTYSMSDDDREITLFATLLSAASATVSVSLHMQVLYHMP